MGALDAAARRPCSMLSVMLACSAPSSRGPALKRMFLLGLAAWLAGAAGVAAGQPIGVSAAASLRNVLRVVNDAYERRNNERVSAVFGPSFRLANDIARGAVPDVFISADPASVAYLEERRLVRGDVLMELVRNRLVIVGRAGDPAVPEGRKAPAALLMGMKAIALPDAQQHPVGRFSQAALAKLGLWERLEPRIRATTNMRSALDLVENGGADGAIVYRTEALRDPQLRILQTLPEATHPPIRYTVAVTTGGRGWPVVSAYVSFIRSQAALDIFEQFGFDRDDAWGKERSRARQVNEGRGAHAGRLG